MGSGASKTLKEAILQGNVEDITKNIRTLFVDDEFPPERNSIGFMHRELDIVWLRPHEFGTGVLFSNGDPRPEDCFDSFPYQNYDEKSISKFLTVVCRALTVRSDYIRRSFVFYNDIVGCCCVRLWNGSSMDFVIVDDRIPCLRSTNQPMFSNTFSGDVWICFLEKAIAKMHGSYEKAYPPGRERDLFRDLTGEIVLEYDVPNILQNHWEKELFQEIQSKSKSGTCGIVTSIICPGSSEPRSFAVMEWGNGSHCGLSHDCCEFLVDIIEDSGDINNNEALVKSNPSLVARPFVDSPIMDGGLPLVAHVAYSDFLSMSHRLSVCLFQSSPDAGQVNGISGEWSIAHGTAMGGRQLNTWRRNPIYRLRVHRRHGLHGLLRICLSQPDKRHLLPDDGSNQHDVYYEAMGLTALKDDPLLTRVLVDSGYKHQRDVVVEMTMGPEEDDTLLLVPSMYHFGVESTFHISICYVVDAEFASQPVSISLVTKWNEYSHKYSVQGEWTSESAPGRLSNVSPETSRNPSWWLRIDANDEEVDCKTVEMLVVIAAEQVITMDADNEDMQVENMKIGTYLMTPYAMSELIFNNGQCGSQDISDGFLNKITFSDEPENPTKYTFQLQRGILSDVCDYRNLVLMASTWKPGCIGRFEITVQCNFPISMEVIDIFHFDRVYKFHDRCAAATQHRQSKVLTKSLQVGTLKQMVNSASMPLSIGSNTNTERSFGGQSEVSLSISGFINRNNTKHIVDKNLEHRWDVLDPKYSNRYNVKDAICSTIAHSQYLVDTGQNVVQLDHFEMAKKTRKKSVRKYHYTGVRHYTPENYYWDKQDENDVSKIETRSQHVIENTKLYDQVGTLRHSTADAIRQQTNQKLEEFYKWRDAYLNGDDGVQEEQEEVNPYLDCY